ncbi:thioredoxin domain-containing protein [Candidatus Saccharibacteria bacterium]|nr:thioredoxin domain-containing protein [Candidatus Saccharibacteria bacterium]
METSEKSNVAGVVGRIVLIVVIIFAIGAAIVASMGGGGDSTPREVWYEEMTMGDLNAKNHFIIYSDIACPYCIAFENAMIEHQEELEQYIEANDILIEVRATDFLFEYGESMPIESRYSAVATYCARDRGKFWEYYDLAVTKVWNEWFKGTGKSSFSEFNKMGRDYWIEMGKSVGLGEDFEQCVKNDETVAQVKEDAKRMVQYVNGLPYFKFNSYVLSGFDLSWGWDHVLMYFDAGLDS